MRRIVSLAIIGLLLPVVAYAQTGTREERLTMFFLVYGLGFIVTILILVALAQKKPQDDSPVKILLQKKQPHDHDE